MNKIMGRTLEDFKNRKYAVLCDTKEKARELCEILAKYGFRDESLFESWGECKKEFCIAKSLWGKDEENTLGFSEREYYEEKLDMDIVEYELGNEVKEEIYNLLELKEDVWYQEINSGEICKLQDGLLIIKKGREEYSNSAVNIRNVFNWKFKKVKEVSKREKLMEMLSWSDREKIADKIIELFEENK